MKATKFIAIASIAIASVTAVTAQAQTNNRQVGIAAAMCTGITVVLRQQTGDRFDRAADILGAISDKAIRNGDMSVNDMKLASDRGRAMARSGQHRDMLPACMSVL